MWMLTGGECGGTQIDRLGMDRWINGAEGQGLQRHGHHSSVADFFS